MSIYWETLICQAVLFSFTRTIETVEVPMNICGVHIKQFGVFEKSMALNFLLYFGYIGYNGAMHLGKENQITALEQWTNPTRIYLARLYRP